MLAKGTSIRIITVLNEMKVPVSQTKRNFTRKNRSICRVKPIPDQPNQATNADFGIREDDKVENKNFMENCNASP